MTVRILPVLFLASLPLAGQTPPSAPAKPNPNASAGEAVQLDKFEVSAREQAFLNSIDRKVYTVGKEIQSATGSASDLLQNIPSVQVDIDGNLSLRGDDSVTVLIDGRSSALMGANRAAALEQMPADSIEKIEVITNPSAKYRPDGTAGIINIVLKKKRDPGYSGSLRVIGGNDRRYSATLSGNYNPGPYNLSGSVGVRQDERVRVATDVRSHPDAATGLPLVTQTRTDEHGRPLSRIGQAGLTYNLSKDAKLGETVDYNYRTFVRHAIERDLSLGTNGAPTLDYDRVRTDPEYEKDVESKTTYDRSFGSDDHRLGLEFRAEDHGEQEDDHYANVYRAPSGSPTTLDHARLTLGEPETEATAEYADPLGDDAKLETGFNRLETRSKQDHFGELQDPATGRWSVDPTLTNRFVLDRTVYALYGTYSKKLGSFGYLAGLRLEEATEDIDQITSAVARNTSYFRAYPTLHLSYDLSDTRQLQLNYSHRVRRPDTDDVNPYVIASDPYSLRAGNPALKPEETHSVEAGYQYHQDDASYVGTAYYRYSYHSFTTVSQYVSSTTLLTTEENLGKSQSGGLELSATDTLFGKLSANASANVFYNQIDASNLGYASTRSTYAWAGKLGLEYDASKATTVQFNANYTARRLTPQGYRLPTFVANLGLKHDFKDKKLSLIVSVSDLFNSLKEETRLNTPALRDDSTRRRSARIIYAGFIYTFGSAKKKAKGDSIPFDNQM